MKRMQKMMMRILYIESKHKNNNNACNLLYIREIPRYPPIPRISHGNQPYQRVPKPYPHITTQIALNQPYMGLYGGIGLFTLTYHGIWWIRGAYIRFLS